jgi:hypothetical protein
VTGRPLLPALTLLLAGVLAGCSPSHPAARPSTRSPAPHVAPQQTGGPLGAPGCQPASPVSNSRWGVPEVEGTGHGASLWGLLMFPHAMPARVGDQEKIVWRMTGSGLLRLAVIGPGGLRERLAWGPAEHEGSNWDKPGQEWGAGYVFTRPGCWDLHAARDHATADVWLWVVSR